METKKHTLLDQLVRRPVTLPEDAYFDQLQTNLLQKIEEKPTVRLLEPQYARWISIGIAASFVLWTGLKSNDVAPSKVDFSGVQKEEIIHYLKDELVQLDEETLLAHVSDEAVTTMSQSSVELLKQENIQDDLTESMNEFLLDDVENAVILDYLEDESFLLEEL